MSKKVFMIEGRDAQFMVEEYTAWYVQILERGFYPREMSSLAAPAPSFFLTWIEQSDMGGEDDGLHALRQLHNDFVAQGRQCLESASKGPGGPEYKDFKKLNILFEEVLRNISLLNEAHEGKQGFVDDLTGLGNARALNRDLQIEMERLARHGKSFTLALIRMNEYEILKSDLDEVEFHSCIHTLSVIIQKCIRSFDDAYWLEDGKFAVCLKQADNTEGIRALARLKLDLEAVDAVYKTNKGMVKLSVSSCITEPMPGDELSRLLHDLEQDLASYKGEKAAVLEHHEISPLERYLKESARS